MTKDIFENVSIGGNKAAKYASQRPSDREIRDLKAAAKRQPRPTPVTPTDNSIEAMRARFNAGSAPVSRSYVSGATKPNAKILRRSKRRTPSGMATTKARELETKIESGDKNPETARRAKDIRSALKNKNKWGTPEARKEEFVLEYLMSNSYADDHKSAIFIYEAMSDQWLNLILEDF